MNKQQQPTTAAPTDNTQLIQKLRAEYNDLNGKIARLNAFLCDIDFIKKVPDIIEQELMEGQLRAMKNYLYNLRGRIMFQEARQREESIKDWSQYKKTDSTYIGVDVSNEGSHSGCCQVCGDDIATHHCGQDATCQVGDGSAVVQDPNESQPAEVLRTKEDVEKKLGIHIHEGNVPKGQCGCMDMKSLLDMQVVGVGNGKCEGCPQDHYGTPCVKVELVGGTYLCLAPLPNSIATE